MLQNLIDLSLIQCKRFCQPFINIIHNIFYFSIYVIKYCIYKKWCYNINIKHIYILIKGKNVQSNRTELQY